MSSKIPVTVLTGFLGSGKTTLLNRILSENHGLRIAIIENEFGEIGVDQDLVINADEEIFEMNNGCICCTVRGDLIRILGNLVRRRDKFDRVILETTGMADPGPVAQTFFVDEDIAEAFALDGIITLVDAKHIQQRWDDSEEAIAQIAFADRIILNKIDLVSVEQRAQVEARIRRINNIAPLIPVQMAQAPIEQVLDVGGFDLTRALEMQPAFLEPEYPFEWGGIYPLRKGAYRYRLSQGPDASMSVVIGKVEAGNDEALGQAAEKLFMHFSDSEERIKSGQMLVAGSTHWGLQLQGQDSFEFELSVAEDGFYALLTQHTPEEFSATLHDEAGRPVEAVAAHYFNAGHSHDDTVSSVALDFPGSIEWAKFKPWLNLLLQAHGADIFRMKGILSIDDENVRYVFQGVHMLFDIQPGRLWGDAPRHNRMVFIGRNLDRDYLEGAFKLCLR